MKHSITNRCPRRHKFRREKPKSELASHQLSQLLSLPSNLLLEAMGCCSSKVGANADDEPFTQNLDLVPPDEKLDANAAMAASLLGILLRDTSRTATKKRIKTKRMISTRLLKHN